MKQLSDIYYLLSVPDNNHYELYSTFVKSPISQDYYFLEKTFFSVRRNGPHNRTILLKKSSAVYSIINRETGEFYIGSTSSPYSRISTHRSKLSLNEHNSLKLIKSFKNSGIVAFDTVIIYVPDRNIAYEIEQLALDLFKNNTKLLNIATDVKCSLKGAVFTPEHKFKIGSGTRGIKKSKEYRLKIKQGLISSNHYPDILSRLKKQAEAKKRPVIINGVKYSGVREAGRRLDLPMDRIRDRIASKSVKFKGYLYE